MNDPRLRLVFISLFLLFTSTPISAEPRSTLNLTVGLESLYDSNLLHYSPSQLDDFHSGLFPDRYALHYSDDLLINPSLTVALSQKYGGSRRRLVRLKATGRFHARNNLTDGRSVSLFWRETIADGRGLSVSAYWYPRYYLRQLLAEDLHPVYSGMSRYRRAEFDLKIAAVAWREPLGVSNGIEIGYQFERRGYNHAFRERDSSLNQGTIGFTRFGVLGSGSLELWGAFRASAARAADGDETPGQPADDVDVSYRGPGLGLEARFNLIRRRPRLDGDFAYEFEQRNYRSERSGDRYHYGRHDRMHAFDLQFTLRLPGRLAVRSLLRYETNKARFSSGTAPTADSGSYHDFQSGLALEWSKAVWKRRAPEPTEEGAE